MLMHAGLIVGAAGTRLVDFVVQLWLLHQKGPQRCQVARFYGIAELALQLSEEMQDKPSRLAIRALGNSSI